MPVPADFADFCCELLASVGSLRKRRMFGGWGLSVDRLTIALVADLGDGARLWLKADAQSQGRFEAAGCARFTYHMRQGERTVARGLNYYNPPDEAMDAAHAMAPWARLALESALKARALADLKADSGTAHAPKRKPEPKDLRPITGKAARKPRAPKVAKTPQG